MPAQLVVARPAPPPNFEIGVPAGDVMGSSVTPAARRALRTAVLAFSAVADL